jgi:hypothetical protein
MLWEPCVAWFLRTGSIIFISATGKLPIRARSFTHPRVCGRSARICLSTWISVTRPSRNAAEIDQVAVRGSFLTEMVFFHRQSRTAIFADLVQNFPPSWFGGWRSVLARLDGICEPNPGAPREWRFTFFNRRAARASLMPFSPGRSNVCSWRTEIPWMRTALPLYAALSVGCFKDRPAEPAPRIINILVAQPKNPHAGQAAHRVRPSVSVNLMCGDASLCRGRQLQQDLRCVAALHRRPTSMNRFNSAAIQLSRPYWI